MSLKRYFLTGYSDQQRLTAIPEIEQIIGRHGFITDFKMFSDISLSIAIEIPENQVAALYQELKTCMRLEDEPALHSDSRRECTLYLNVTFTMGSGDLKQEVPNVPG